MNLIYGSVCSGIEAATMAWEPLGWRPKFFAEIERFPSAVLAHHYGSNMPGEPPSRNGVPNLGDFTTIGPDAGPVDLLVGGTPCQSFSVAGKRLGLDDPRGNLALEYLALAQRLRARWIVWENVPGVLSSRSGDDDAEDGEGLESADFATFLSFVRECGYGFAYRVLDAQHVRSDGFSRAVPQRRRRVFVVGYLGDWRRAAAVLLEPEGLRGDPPPRRQAGQGVAGAVSASSGRRGGVDDPERGKLVAFGGGNLSGSIEAAACLTAKGQRIDFEVETFVTTRPVAATLTRGAESQGKGGYAGRRQEDDDNLVAHSLMRGEGFDASEDGTGRGTPLVPVFSMQERMESLNPSAGPNGKGWSDDGSAFTLEARRKPQSIATSWAVRRLTPRECERLQGFPDDFTDVPWRDSGHSPDGPRYKALGNSMAVNVMRWIGARIDLMEQLVKDGFLPDQGR
ncbi:DNA cytosine methyltransferase [Tianweitania sediminis]|uniref:DNA (cytosine-5-)-methyltransferase n=1 Tax=Tianweitania sediminis TaxID=1502156 RepID=A0A8J7R1C8_9HYPH|nr:DNA cytosine methyltransferase [Tianweitania sediminis]MBP0438436.1 DNA cytosine methyltransferase [Tianweitania sediminis]